MALFEGNVQGKVVNPEFGADAQGKPRVRWNMIVVGGPHDGKQANYSGKLDEQNIKFTKRDMIAVGWKGKDVRTFAADATAAADKIVPFTAEIASFTRDNGKVSEWTSVKNVGFAATPLAPLDADKVANVNRWFEEAGEIGQGKGKPGDDPLPF